MKRFVWRRAAAISRKEIYHILRDPFTLSVALILPVFMVIMFGIAIEFNVKFISLAVNDSDKTQASRRLADTFASSEYFQDHNVASAANAVKELSGEKARAALIIPPDFEEDLMSGRGAEAQILVDGSDNSTVGPILGYLGTIQSLAAKKIADFNPPAPFQLRTRFQFNPELNSRWFTIPGINVLIMTMLSILLTALTVAREWESGSMELLLSTPVQPLEIMVGKLAPFGALGIIAITFVYFIARVVFGVPFVGSLLVFFVGCVLFLITYLAQGFLISVTTRNQLVAMQLAFMTGMLPSQLLSGFIFPVESMPTFFHYFTMILPARWFMQISRDTFLKGSNIIDLAEPFLAITILGLIMITLSIRRFKRDLEP